MSYVSDHHLLSLEGKEREEREAQEEKRKEGGLGMGWLQKRETERSSERRTQRLSAAGRTVVQESLV